MTKKQDPARYPEQNAPRNEASRVSRRDFLVAAGVGMAGVTLGASSIAHALSGDWDEETDVIVVGSGGGGLVGAFAAASRGLRTLVIEKTGYLGGTTAYSGAGLWFPGSPPITRAGHDDNLEQGRTYLRAVVNDPSREALQDAYLDTAVELIGELETHPWFSQFWYQPGIPDYFPDHPGASLFGSTIFPPDLPAAELGDNAVLIRKNLPAERWGEPLGDVLTGGRALIGRALGAFLATGNGAVRLNTALTELVVDDGHVVGVKAVGDGTTTTLRARRGVILAAGGFERNRELRAKYQAEFLTGADSNGAPQNTGDALLAGMAVGAATDLLDEAWFAPGVVQPDGLPLFHTGTRGGIWVNGAGERFVNETSPYDQAGHELYRLQKTSGITHVPAYWIIDQRQLDRDSIGGPPDHPPRPEWFESGALKRFDSLDAVADHIRVPTTKLTATIAEFNGYGAGGVDAKFRRGETPWDKFSAQVVGYPASVSYPKPVAPELENQLVIPIEGPPYYVLEVRLSDIGTKGGLKTDTDARVLRADGSAVDGLYATGNTMAAMSGRVYPAAGTPIGSSLVFAYRAARHIAGA